MNGSHSSVHWTEAELDIIKKLYPEAPREDILTALPGRTWSAVRAQARLIGARRKARGGGVPWSDEEIRILRERGSELGADEVSGLLPGRTAYACGSMMVRLGIRMPHETRSARASARMAARDGTWTVEEDAVVKRMYADSPIRDIMDALPGRTAVAIRRRAAYFGIKRSPEARSAELSKAAKSVVWPKRAAAGPGKGAPWSESELETMRLWYGLMPVKALAEWLPGRTPQTVMARAGKLGLTRPAKGDENE